MTKRNAWIFGISMAVGICVQSESSQAQLIGNRTVGASPGSIQQRTAGGRMGANPSSVRNRVAGTPRRYPRIRRRCPALQQQHRRR